MCHYRHGKCAHHQIVRPSPLDTGKDRQGPLALIITDIAILKPPSPQLKGDIDYMCKKPSSRAVQNGQVRLPAERPTSFSVRLTNQPAAAQETQDKGPLDCNLI